MPLSLSRSWLVEKHPPALCRMSAMRLLLRSPAIVLALALALATLSAPAHAADKLNGFYIGSGGLSQEVHRVLLIEFAADGTAILQQKWHDKDPQTWHAHWKRDKNQVTLTYDDKPPPEPLVFTFKH